jgi:hypothetical protein
LSVLGHNRTVPVRQKSMSGLDNVQTWTQNGLMFSQLAYVRDQLSKVKFSGWREVSKGSGVPLSTIKKIGYGITEFPRSDTADKLAMYFRTREKRRA